MNRLQHKLLSLLVILAMVITLLPAGVSKADAEYFRFTNFSTNIDDPTQVNTDTVSIVGSFNGVSANSITYQIEQIVNGNSVNISRGTGVNPIIENGNTFKFMNVSLFQGLNKITILGTNPSGNQVPGVAYVNFSNVPVIYDLKLVDGRTLEAGQPLVVSSPTTVILLKSPNADRVTVNGKIAYNAGDDSFILSDLGLAPGLNELAIVSSNATMTYTLQRQVVYYANMPTAYDTAVVNAAGTPDRVSLEGNPTVGPNNGTGDALTGRISGKLVFRAEAGIQPEIPIELDVYADGVLMTTLQTTKTLLGEVNGFRTYEYTADTDHTFNANGKYTVRVKGRYGTNPNADYPVSFTYRNANTAYLTELNQIYNASLDGGGYVVFDSSTVFPNNSMIFELPIWLEAKIENTFDINDVTLSATQNGVPVSNLVFNYDKYMTTEGSVAFRINNLPAGEQNLTVTVNSAGGIETKQVKINYVPAPFIQLSNLYNGKVFTDNGVYPTDEDDLKRFTTIKGRLVNFNNTGNDPDQSSVTIKINGKQVRLIDHLAPATTIVNGHFDFVVPSDMLLVNGPNQITISGIANGIPVSTSITAYLFSDEVPTIMQVKPVPHDPLSPRVDDPYLKFKNTGANQFVTNEKKTDVLFNVQNADKVIINVDGNQEVVATINSATGEVLFNKAGVLQVDSMDLLAKHYTFRLINHALPNTGVRNIVIQATLGSTTVSQTLQITREIPPYLILSPKLPNERVINQNFLPVAIQAEGADSVLLGKSVMVKEANDIFRLELRNLKVGVNKIAFTVIRGTQKLNGTFEVNYAGTFTQGAQYKATVPKTGSLKVFNGNLELKLPKGSLLKQANSNPGQDSPTTDLFDTQQMLFGIADRVDGRTIEKYNVDGEIRDIQPMDIATNLLKVPAHFGYASQLFWTDAGYFDTSSLSQWSTVQGQHPYETNNEFYMRNINKWMEPSARGQIILKYDADIRDVVARKLSVWRFANNTWKNLGGVVNLSNKTVTAAFDGFGYYAVFYDAYSFDDVIGHSYARNQVETMFAKGIMLPKDNNEFGVYDNINRGEFATMMVKMLDLPLTYDPNNLTFDDVINVSIPGALYDYRYIETAVRRGIIRGMGPRIFGPNANLTREQAAVMIARAMNLRLNTDATRDLTSLQKLFTDANTIDYYAITSIQAVAKEGIIVGRPNALVPGTTKPTYRFDPHSYLNRGDAAIIVEKVMTKMKRL